LNNWFSYNGTSVGFVVDLFSSNLNNRGVDGVVNHISGLHERVVVKTLGMLMMSEDLKGFLYLHLVLVHIVGLVHGYGMLYGHWYVYGVRFRYEAVVYVLYHLPADIGYWYGHVEFAVCSFEGIALLRDLGCVGVDGSALGHRP